MRCHGTARLSDGTTRSWSVFVKQVQHPAEWEHLYLVPEPLREEFVNSLPWRLEIDVYASAMAQVLPPGLRSPRLYGVVEINDRRASLWMEDVVVDQLPWELPRFVRAAELLGRLAARRPEHGGLRLSDDPATWVPGAGVRYYARGRLAHFALPLLGSDDFWGHPVLAAQLEALDEASLRGDLDEAAQHIETWLDLADSLPQTYAHGDVAPGNLLVPVSEPGSFVLIDWSFHSPLPVGFDLGQLLVGGVQEGDVDPARLPALAAAVLTAYHRGVSAEGFSATPTQVRQGFAVSVVLRTVFTALPLEQLVAPPPQVDQLAALEKLVATRIRLCRFLLTLAAELPR